MKQKTEKSTMTVGGFNTPCLNIGRITRKKTSKAVEEINNTFTQHTIVPLYVQLAFYVLVTHSQLEPKNIKMKCPRNKELIGFKLHHSE